MIISRKRTQHHPPLFFMNNELSPTNNITLLGISIANTLSWAEPITGIAKKTAKRLYILGRSGDLLPQQARITVYKYFIRPIMNMLHQSGVVQALHLWLYLIDFRRERSGFSRLTIL